MPLKIFVTKNFLGRDRELEILQHTVSEAGTGDASGIFLSGHRGVGKTELLGHLFNHLFWQQDKAIPFFYSIRPAFSSLEEFSKDYISRFILQSLAFLRKDPVMISQKGYSLEDLRGLAEEEEIKWVNDLIKDYLQATEPAGVFLSAISAPYRSYLNTGMPVVVMIDNFDRIQRLHLQGLNNHGLWTFFEEPIKSRYTPHILTGLQGELQRMFFYDTSIGEHLELMPLKGLDGVTSKRLFMSLCDLYNIHIEADIEGIMDLFNGNPLYIKSFIQAARRAGRSPSVDDLWTIYFNEITDGKIQLFWLSHLKAFISQQEAQKAVELLYHLCENPGISLIELAGRASIEQKDLDRLLTALQSAGVVEGGFSTVNVINDRVFIDVIKGLYHREVLNKPSDQIRELIIGERLIGIKKVEEPFFEITIPSAPKAELVAVKTLEQIAQRHNLPLKTIGQLQIALVELFTSVIEYGSVKGNYHVRFRHGGNTFSIEVEAPEMRTVADREQALKMVRPYLDDIKIEETLSGSKIILVKEINPSYRASSPSLQ